MSKGRWRFFGICLIAFVLSFGCSVATKLLCKPAIFRQYSVKWDDSMGTIVRDIPYGDGDANKFDLYLPSDKSRETYRLVVYLHPGGFTSGDKSGDKDMLQWLCSKGYVAAGINYTLRTDENNANIYTQSMEIKSSMPKVIEEAQKLGYRIDAMGIAGGSAGGTLAMLYAYRDAKDSPVPVKMMFEAVGPCSFYPDDWDNYGLDKSPEAAAVMFSVMSGQTITPEMFGTPEYEELIKPISAYMWIDADSVPSVVAYGQYDKVQPFKGTRHLKGALEKYNVPHEFIVASHSGHGLQNDNKAYALYLQKVVEYLDRYLPVCETPPFCPPEP